MVQIFFDWANFTMDLNFSPAAGDSSRSDLVAPWSEEPHVKCVEWLERAVGPIVAKASEYTDGHVVPPHRHSRAQMIYALSGVVTVTMPGERWMVPPDHALWVPAGTVHSVAASGHVSMRSIYVKPGAVADLPSRGRVVELTGLMRSLMLEAVNLPQCYEPASRAGLVMALILEEIPRLPVRPLGLPFPADPRMAALCHRFLDAPTTRTGIDDWAAALAMSRRTFTRAFRRETGLSLSEWRQQASLFAALPRLAGGESVTSVALDLGYDSSSAFSTMFKRMTGATPGRYLREAESVSAG
ncbi:AraC family transcriptional regulator [Pleomorphomonas koreensis]|uniref:AraC family transcriptional regulator n=1 Tax=Pleomorphomonas koreensis TaxID=257440 RepID=UPI000415C31E|nr:helix-turn-helix transcriptional regulator [Pleomorphomonas koreensis]